MYNRINCSERLPEAFKNVFVEMDNGSKAIAFITDHGYWLTPISNNLPKDIPDPEYWLEPVGELNLTELYNEIIPIYGDIPYSDGERMAFDTGFKIALELLNGKK